MNSLNQYNSSFIWHDLVTFEVERAIQFYSELLGWKFQPYDMGGPDKYNMIHVGDKRIGGLMKPEKDNIPAHWMGYISHQNIRDAALRIKKLKGNLFVEPTEIPDIGKFAICEDNKNAVFALFATGGSLPQEIETPENLEFCRDEYFADHPEQSKKFYEEVFNWKYSHLNNAETSSSWIVDCRDNAGSTIALKNIHSFKSNRWISYIKVMNLNKLMTRHTQGGGRVIQEPFQVSPHGRASIIEDSVGATIGLFEALK